MSTQLRTPVHLETTCAKYIVTSIIGEGGAGRVYEATDESGASFAIKVLSHDKASGEKRKRFKNELQFCSRNRHPNIVTVLDHGVFLAAGASSPFYVMALYKSSLRHLITAGIGSDSVLRYFGQLIDGVEAAHLLGVTHRDLKPENVLYDTTNDRLIVADFGTAQFTDEELYTLIETGPGTRLANFQYAAPEQRARGQEVDHRADIYAVGLILNEMFTRAIPQGTGYRNIASVELQLAYLDEIVADMIRQTAADRPASIDKVKQLLIGRQNEFITRQRLSVLTNSVVATTEVDDPLIIDPIRLIGCDWSKGRLTLMLSRPVNGKWVTAFRTINEYSAVMGKGPQEFTFRANTAVIEASERRAQRIVDLFKDWLPRAAFNYEEDMKRERAEAERVEASRLEQEADNEQRRLYVLQNVKI